MSGNLEARAALGVARGRSLTERRSECKPLQPVGAASQQHILLQPAGCSAVAITPTTEVAQPTVSVPELNPHPPVQTGLSTAALGLAP